MTVKEPRVEEYHLTEAPCDTWIGIQGSKIHHQCGEPAGHKDAHVCVAGDYTQPRKLPKAVVYRPDKHVEQVIIDEEAGDETA